MHGERPLSHTDEGRSKRPLLHFKEMEVVFQSNVNYFSNQEKKQTPGVHDKSTKQVA